jgi:hypothetical protein
MDRAAWEEREPALLPAGEANPGETNERCVSGVHRGSSEAGEDVAGVGMSEMRVAQRRGGPTRPFRETGRSL